MSLGILVNTKGLHSLQPIALPLSYRGLRGFCNPHLLIVPEVIGFSKAFEKLFFCHAASGFQQLMQAHSHSGEALLRFRIEGIGQKATGVVFAGFVLALAATGGGFYVSR
jgi:hypothetical protein